MSKYKHLLNNEINSVYQRFRTTLKLTYYCAWKLKFNRIDFVYCITIQLFLHNVNYKIDLSVVLCYKRLRGRRREGKEDVLTTTLIARCGFSLRAGHVVASLDKTLYDDYLCLVVSNNRVATETAKSNSRTFQDFSRSFSRTFPGLFTNFLQDLKFNFDYYSHAPTPLY